MMGDHVACHLMARSYFILLLPHVLIMHMPMLISISCVMELQGFARLHFPLDTNKVVSN